MVERTCYQNAWGELECLNPTSKDSSGNGHASSKPLGRSLAAQLEVELDGPNEVQVSTVSSCLSGPPEELLWSSIPGLARQCLKQLKGLNRRLQYTHLVVTLGLSPAFLHSDWAGIIERRIKKEFAAVGLREVPVTLNSLDRWSVTAEDPGSCLPRVEIAVLTCSALRFPPAKNQETCVDSPTQRWVRTGSIAPVKASTDKKCRGAASRAK